MFNVDLFVRPIHSFSKVRGESEKWKQLRFSYLNARLMFSFVFVFEQFAGEWGLLALEQICSVKVLHR